MSNKIHDWFECSAVTRWIEIEITNYCTLNCIICPRKRLKEIGFLSFENFIKVVDFIIEWNYTEVLFCWLWDSFTHKELNKFLDYFFLKLPNAKLFFMTKWQSLKDEHINKIKELNDKWFNVSISFSIFSLKKELHNQLVWWDNYDQLITSIKKCDYLNVNYSLEFLLSTLTFNELDSFKKFAKTLKRDTWISVVHNWWWSVDKKTHKKFFSEELFKWYYRKRNIKEDRCEAVKYDYFSIDCFANVYQCTLNRISKDSYLWNVWEYSFKEFLERKNDLDYNKMCSECFYFDHQLFV